ncbi:MAG: glycosyltransferase [Phycisphaerae bacterium]|nr:glycosyltransferase [Phycisphaerae bacterium]MDW8261586.1 glycosyltransferase [Phycisphaerales bacterium]
MSQVAPLMNPHSAPVSAQSDFVPGGRQRRMEAPTNRVRRDGKFFRLGAEKFFVKGVTYGPFAPNADGDPFPAPDRVRSDFVLIRQLNANCIRIYHTPPRWFLDLAQEIGLKILLDVAWPKNMTFVGDPELTRQAQEAVRAAARTCGNHPAVFALSVVNEIPPDIVRYVGKEKVEDFIDDLVAIARSEAPECLITFANFPTTEYLQPRDIDFVCFNVYLHEPEVFRNYLARLQMIAGEKPLMLGEYGIDTLHERSEEDQAKILAAHVRAVFDEGLVGTFIFSFTDEWFTGGYPIDNWAFGIVRRDRSPKKAFAAVAELYARAPQLCDEPLPRCSVIVCSYNGASTTEACLRSLARLRYPGEFEVIFVDDGSTDHTQEILRQFPWVRNIRQNNMGLSYARNVGMQAATGEIIVYTDSDCEADEDWLYYLVLTLKNSRHVGVGGPNLIPDEGSWVADCVGLSPGGPTHVMIDDRTAEHVPGCNMAFYRWAAMQINGFDPQFRSAGDDVDFIWRLQHRGWSIGFAPSAQVWHYRRNTVKAYLKQQRGYGAAEAMLKYKHPDHFNALGASFWRGRIYGADQVGVRFGGDVVYHGVFGTGLFQTIYRKSASLVAAMLMSIEWHMLAGFIALLSLAVPPLIWVSVGMLLVPIGLAITAAVQAPRPRHRHWLTRPLIAYLHWRQPLTRGWARYSVRLKNKVLSGEASGFRRSALPLDPQDKRTLRYWHQSADRLPLLQEIVRQVQSAGWRMRVDSGWAPWDLEIYGSRYCKVRLTTATEHYGSSGNMTRVRVELGMSRFCMVLTLAGGLLAGLILLSGFPTPHLWPFGRPAVLIPIAWWTMYLVNKARVAAPVLGLVDLAAEQARYTPMNVLEERRKPAVTGVDEEELEESASLA